MTHEPECPQHWDIGDMPEPCVFCQVIRPAYQRGRDDAAQQVDNAITAMVSLRFGDRLFMVAKYDARTVAVAAARGDGAE